MDEAIKNAIKLTVNEAFGNGSRETENAIFRAVMERKEDDDILVPSEYKGIVRALYNGVLAIITDAAEEVRERHEI